VEAQTETVWRQADRYHVPRICFVNKMDRLGADFEKVVGEIEDRLGAVALVAQLPIGRERDFRGVVDLVRMKAHFFEGEGQDTRRVEGEIPPEMAEEAALARESLVEKVAEEGDAVGEWFIAEKPVGAEALRAGIREMVVNNKGVAVFCGSSLRFRGVQLLMDAVCDYLPSPLDVPPVEAKLVKTGKPVKCPVDPEAPLAALAFKIAADRHDDLTYVRVYSGTLRPGRRLYNPNKDVKENVSRVYRMRANRRDEAVDAAGPGDIVGVVGFRQTTTGDTLCEGAHPILLEDMRFPQTVIDMAVEPKSSADKDRFEEALKRLEREDPTFETRVDRETGQRVISGMGELHLDVLKTRILEEFNVDVHVGPPRVAYKETIAQAHEVEERFVRQAGAATLYAMVKLRLEPCPLDGKVVFESDLAPEALEKRFLDAVRGAVLDAAQGGGGRTGYPVVNTRVRLVGAEQRDKESNELAFEAAAGLAFRRGMEEAASLFGAVLLEPIMALEVVAPENYLGDVLSDLNSRRATIEGVLDRGGLKVVTARTPLAEMFGYTTTLRSLTQGRGTASMEPCDYAPAPKKVFDQMVV